MTVNLLFGPSDRSRLTPDVQVNQQVAMSTFKAFDVGGSITIHAFGAYYGLSASLMLSRRASDSICAPVI